MDFFKHLQVTRAHWQPLLSDPYMLFAFTLGISISAFILLWINWSKAKPTLDPTRFQEFPLINKEVLSSNTAKYRFALPKKDSMLGLPIGQHLQVQADVNGKMVQRSYTPVTSDDDLGFFDLVIKTYPQGNVSAYVGSLKIGDSLSVKGPRGQMRYHSGLAKHIGLVAGGTGLTPILQVVTQVLKDPEDHTQLDFLYGNVSEGDILLKSELDRLAAENEQFRVHYFLNEPPEGWKGGEGHISKEAIQRVFPKPSRDSKVLMCGPPPMINACKKHLEELGFDQARTVSKMEDQVFCF